MTYNVGYTCRNDNVRHCLLGYNKLDIATNNYLKIESVLKNNMEYLLDVLDYNSTNDIKLFRISSNIISLISYEPTLKLLRSNEFTENKEFKDLITAIKEKAKNNNLKLSLHPGQYNNLISANSETVARAINNLKRQQMLSKLFNCETIVLHIGNNNTLSKTDSLKRFKDIVLNFFDKDFITKLAIENDEGTFKAEDVATIAKELGCKWVYDFHHERINKTANIVELLRLHNPDKIHISDNFNYPLARYHEYYIWTKTLKALESQLNEAGIRDTNLMFESRGNNYSILDAMYHTEDIGWQVRDFNDEHFKVYEKNWKY